MTQTLLLRRPKNTTAIELRRLFVVLLEFFRPLSSPSPRELRRGGFPLSFIDVATVVIVEIAESESLRLSLPFALLLYGITDIDSSSNDTNVGIEFALKSLRVRYFPGDVSKLAIVVDSFNCQL